MSPSQLRQLAAARITTRNKATWAEQAAQALRDAAAELERLQAQKQARMPCVLRVYADDTEGGAL